MHIANDNWRDRVAVTIAEAQAVLHVSRSTIVRMIRSGHLTTFKVGRAVRIRVAGIASIIDANGEAAA